MRGSRIWAKSPRPDAALAPPLLDDVRALQRQTLVVVDGRSRRSAWRSRRAVASALFAYESTLRVPLIIAQVGRPATVGRHNCRSGRRASASVTSARCLRCPRGTSTSCRRSSKRPAEPVPADLPGRSATRPPLNAGPDRRRVRCYFEALSAQLNRGWAPLTGVLVDRDKVHRSADGGALRPGVRSGRAHVTSWAAPPIGDRALVAALRDVPRRRARARAPPRMPTRPRSRDRSASYVSGGAALEACRTRRRRRSEEARRAGRSGASRRGGVRRRPRSRTLIQICISRSSSARPDMAIAYRHLAVHSVAARPGERTRWRRSVARSSAASPDPRVIAQLGGYLADSGRVAEGIRLLEPLARGLHATPTRSTPWGSPTRRCRPAGGGAP